MADKHPYVSAPGGLEKTLSHLRRSFPTAVNSSTLKKLGFAPNNESYVLNVLRFLNLIDETGKKTSAGATIFSKRNDTAFAPAFGAQIQKSYSGLFDLHGDQSWKLDKDALASFFRASDQTTEIVGQRQATTFQLLAKHAGRGDTPEANSPKNPARKPDAAEAPRRREAVSSPTTRPDDSESTSTKPAESLSSRVGLTVRIEINLPADGDQRTYDRIFKSIREHFLND